MWLGYLAYLDEGPKGARNWTPRGRRGRNASSISLPSLCGSIRQKLPLPGSSWLRGTFIKYLEHVKGVNYSMFHHH